MRLQAHLVYQTFEFKAKAEKTFLGFYVISLSGDPNKGVLIDDVSMTSDKDMKNLITDGGFELRKKPVN